MGCGCAKRADKLLRAADAKKVRLAKPVRRFLERKAATITEKDRPKK